MFGRLTIEINEMILLSSMLQQWTFLNVTRGSCFGLDRMSTTGEFNFRVREAISKLGRLLTWPEEKLNKLYQKEKKTKYQDEIRIAAESLIKRRNKKLRIEEEEQDNESE